ncbi:hypothetical protein P389DRAFT_196298 [Cystobasidium minutum MCA 4210]|uniref:uncharacterized protein n=1 Tax=Cystobasidium minutum MCA 4210 TaxID=1397322 RepID=UPI0034CF181C|eukprot:jgi/Rhomi1/196298/gm1.4512_g
MTGSPAQGKPTKIRHPASRRQALIDDTPESDGVVVEDALNAPLRPVENTADETITVINGHTVEPALPTTEPLVPVPNEPLSSDSEVKSATSETSTSTRRRPPRPVETDAEETEDEEETSPSPTILDSPSTRKILTSISPTLASETTSKSKIKSVSSTKTTKTKPNTQTGLSGKAKGNKEEQEGGGGPSATTWIAIALAIVGGLLLIMAISAYYRRWRRRRRSSPDDESFVAKDPEPLPETPRSLARSSMASEKYAYGPDWSDAPLVPPIPAAYSQQPGHENLLPEPGSDRMPEDVAPWRRDSYAGNTSPIPPAVPRYPARNEPMAIETAGDARLFSRPASEVILNGQAEQYTDQTYDYAQPSHPPNVRHKSYASSRYEAIEETPESPRRYQYI